MICQQSAIPYVTVRALSPPGEGVLFGCGRMIAGDSVVGDLRRDMRLRTVAALVIYLLTIPVANWMINNVGTQGFPGGPHTIPVGFGFAAPSGVLLIGVALFMRDFVQEQTTRKTVLGAIVVGMVLSYVVNPGIAFASATAFVVGELADFAVYTPVKRRSLPAAVVLSGVIGGVTDSFLFLWIAFRSTQYWEGQVLGKLWMSLFGGLMVWGSRAVSQRMRAEEAASSRASRQ